MYVLYVKTGKEDPVKKRLDELGIKALVPKCFKYKRVKGNWKSTLDVIFKSYVFLDIDYSAENYYKIIEIDDVIRFLKSDTKVLSLSHLEKEWISILNKFASKASKIELKEDGFKIISGVLENFETKVVKIDKHKRLAHIEINLFNELHKIVMGVDIV